MTKTSSKKALYLSLLSLAAGGDFVSELMEL
jgi:hypothetical protein